MSLRAIIYEMPNGREQVRSKGHRKEICYPRGFFRRLFVRVSFEPLEYRKVVVEGDGVYFQFAKFLEYAVHFMRI